MSTLAISRWPISIICSRIFGEDGKALDDFMIHYTANPDHPEDSTLWNGWQGVSC